MRLSISVLSSAAIVAIALPSSPRVDVVVGVNNGRIQAPDTVAPGWSRIRVDEDGEGHIAVIFRLPPNTTDSSIASLLAVLDTAAATPGGVTALGGPEIGDTGEVIVRLMPGRYLIGCVRRGADGHRHLHNAEWKTLTVRRAAPDAAHAKPPAARHVVRMVDYAFTGKEKWTAGKQLLRIENNGHQDHQLRLVRLRDNATMGDWIETPKPGVYATPVVGLARMSVGQVAYLPLDLTPGRYVAHCLVTDPATGRQHMQLGMYRLIQVE